MNLTNLLRPPAKPPERRLAATESREVIVSHRDCIRHRFTSLHAACVAYRMSRSTAEKLIASGARDKFNRVWRYSGVIVKHTPKAVRP